MKDSKFAPYVHVLDVGNACNLNCKQCFYASSNKSKLEESDQLEKIHLITDSFVGANFFIYPMEISTSEFLLPVIMEFGQKKVLSNGILLTDEFVDELISKGISQVKTTLYSTYKEQAFFYNMSEYQYECLKKNIVRCVKKGLDVVVNLNISKVTMNSVPEFIELCRSLGVKRIELLRLLPISKATKLDRDIFIYENDMLKIVEIIEKYKLIYDYPRFRYYLNFGPDIYKKTLQEAASKITNNHSGNLAFCPAIDHRYLGCSLKTGDITSCLFAKNEEEFNIGKFNFDNGEYAWEKKSFFSPDYLIKNLRDYCHKDNCQYQSVCLGGCRCAAFSFARLRGENNPLFAGMDICVTKCKEKLGL